MHNHKKNNYTSYSIPTSCGSKRDRQEGKVLQNSKSMMIKQDIESETSACRSEYSDYRNTKPEHPAKVRNRREESKIIEKEKSKGKCIEQSKKIIQNFELPKLDISSILEISLKDFDDVSKLRDDKIDERIINIIDKVISNVRTFRSLKQTSSAMKLEDFLNDKYKLSK